MKRDGWSQKGWQPSVKHARQVENEVRSHEPRDQTQIRNMG